jgi:hypothetical protein
MKEMRIARAKFYIARHRLLKHQLPLKKNLKEFLSSWDVEGKRLNIFKSKSLQRPTEVQFSRSSED